MYHQAVSNVRVIVRSSAVSVLILLASLRLCLAQYSHTIYVDPVRGNDSKACLESPSPSQPCRNLSYAFQYRNSSTQYVLQPGTHYLNSTASDKPFTDLHDIAITGNGSIVSVVCYTTNTGIAFINVENITLKNVSFSRCSSLQNSTSVQSIFDKSFHLENVLVALYFSNCDTITMLSVCVEYSSNATGVIMYNTIGTNTFTRCHFSNNANTDPKGVGPGGGGVYIEFSYCLPGNTSCGNGIEESYTDHNRNSKYEFSTCLFNNNHATNQDPLGPKSFLLPYRQNHEAFGRGGGLSVFFKANATGNSVNVNGCDFSDNRALWGAGLYVDFHDTATGNSISVIDSRFENNSVLPDVETAGGGMRVGHFVFGDGASIKGNVVTVERCNFTSNSAVSGGGLSFSPSGQWVTNGELANVTITDCYFVNNSARLGLALQIMRFGLIAGLVPNVVITNIFIVGSYLYYLNNTKAYEVGGGALYMGGVWVDFKETANFIHNSASALIVIRAEASFQNCSANFTENESLKGGAILLLGSSSLSINESTEMYFFNNTAKWEGGAIYKQYDERDNMPQDPHCFIRHVNPFLDPDDWKSLFHFVDNRDHQGEIAIHSTSLKPCVWAGGKSIGDISVNEVFCWKNWFYNKNRTQNDHCKRYLSSAPGNITYDYAIKEFPGIEVKLPIHVFDDLSRMRKAGFHAFSLDTDKAQINKAFEFIADNTIKFSGVEGESFELELDSTTQRLWHFVMNVTIKECPPGFVATDNTSHSTCVCSDNTPVSFTGTVLCDSDGNQYTTKLSGGHWMGLIEGTTLVGNCPPRYCFRSETDIFNPLPQSFAKLDDHICGSENRTGILCGQCKGDYGPAINSRSNRFNCVYCKNVNTASRTTYYILLVYVPLFLLFLAIIVFNIKLTTGPANAFILYSQVISSTFDLSADGQIPLDLSMSNSDSLLLAYQFPYGILNLRFFEQFVKPFCLSSSLNTIDVLALDYAVGFFPLVMILLIIVYVKLKGCCRGRCNMSQNLPPSCGRFGRFFPRIGDAVIPAFASFLLLSYSKFNLTSSYIISQRPLVDASGNLVDSRVYYAGHYSSSDSEYIFKYMIPAIILLVLLGAIPPLLLLQYPLKWCEAALDRVSCLRKRYPSTKVHIFLDAFQGSFKHRMRFFAGLYFIFRLIIDLSYTLSKSWVEHYVVQEIVCILFIVLLAFCRPYKREYHLFNFVDIAMFANLAIITALGLYLYAVLYINPHQNPPRMVIVLQYILVLLPLACMLAYVIWVFILPRLVHLCRKLSKNRADGNSGSFLNSQNFTATNTWSVISSTNQGAQRNIEVSGSGIDWERAKHRNTYCRSPTVSPHEPPPGAEGHENDKLSRSRSGNKTTSSHDTSNDDIKSPLLPTSTYVTAIYGSSDGNTNETTGGSLNGSIEGHHDQ